MVDLKKYCNDRGISLFGDMPIYVAEDSADTWTHPEVFRLDKNRIPKAVAGVPPDYFSEDGQLWGNPLYRWKYLRLHGYGWWVERMRGMAELYDMIRVERGYQGGDHKEGQRSCGTDGFGGYDPPAAYRSHWFSMRPDLRQRR